MARGTVNNEPVVSQANTEAFREGYDRAFGERKAERGRWVWDDRQKKLVPAGEYRPEPMAIDATVIVGRQYENQRLPDGTIVNSRAQYNAYLREKGVTNASDFGPGYAERVRAEQRREEERQVDRAVRESFERLTWGGRR